MSDWVKSEWAGWTDQTMYLPKMTGEAIVEIYNAMNKSGNKHIVATTINMISSLPPEPPLYDIFIFYKDRFGNVKL